MASLTPSIPLQPNVDFTVGLSWDQTSSKPADLDLACVAIGPTGLIIDACFFNNPLALSGALIHSGDKKSGDSTGIDESITVLSGQIPPSTYSLIFCLMQPGSSDLQACETAQLHVWSPQTQAALQAPISLGAAVPHGCHFSVLSICRRQQGGVWSFDTVLHPIPPPATNFMDVIPQLLSLVNIDPIMAQEMKNSQPTFRLTKDNSWMLPIGFTSVAAGLGWESTCDVDASCLAYNAQGSNLTNVYFGNKTGLKGAIHHSGDNRTGAGSGDDEVINLKVSEFPPEVDAIFFTVCVFSGGDFRNVKGEYWRLVDTTPGPNHGKELVRFDSLDNGSCRSVILVALYRNLQFPSQWIVSAPACGANASSSSSLIGDCEQVQALFRNNGTLPPGWKAKRYCSGIVGPAAPPAPPAPRCKITLNGGNNFPAMDFGGTSDPYCIVVNQIKRQVLKTKTHKKTLNPVWGESLLADIGSKLHFKVYDYDAIGSDDKIGRVKNWVVPDVGPGQTQMTLEVTNKKGKPCGTISLTLEKVL